MKKTLLASAIATAMISSTAMAAPEKMVDYFNVSMGTQDVDTTGFDSGMALIGTVGKDMNDTVQNLSAEVEMTKTIDEAGFDQTTILGSTSGNADIFSLGGYAVYNFPATPKFKIRGKGGLLYRSVSAEACLASVCASADESDFDLSYGFGATWNVANNFDVLSEYTILDSDISNLSLGMKYKFN